MELTGLLQAVSALREAREGADFVLRARGVADGMARVLDADRVSLSDFDARAERCVTLELWPARACPVPRGPAAALGRPGQALVMSLPAPPGLTRRLVFHRRPGRPFGEEERSAAVLLQPHVADALRWQGRRVAGLMLTRRQRELLGLVAAGHDNVAIARQLGLSPSTVRKHLENAFARLEVTSRTAAVAKMRPDATWLDQPAVATAVPG